MSGQRQSISPFSSTGSTTSKLSKPEDPSSYKCSCGTGDGSGNYIQCDNEKCKVSWYHWACVQVTEIPVGTWLCPNCSPSAAFYIKQLVKKWAASPVVPKVEMTDEGAGSKTRKQRQKSVLEVNKEKGVAKKGIALKKHGEEKPKPKWKGWVELSSDGEQEFKLKVDAQWDVEDDLAGKRRRDSKAVAEKTELSPRVLRTRSKSEQHIKKRAEHEQEVVEEEESEEADSEDSAYSENEDTHVHRTVESEESLYQEDPQDAPLDSTSSDETEDSDEAPVVRRRGRIIYISSTDSDDSDDTMDVDDSSPTIETHTPDSLFDPPPSSSSREDTPSDPGQATSASKGKNNNNEEPARESETEDTEDSTDMEVDHEDSLEYQDEEPKASNHNNQPAGPEDSSVDDTQPSSPESIRTPTDTSHDSEMTDSQNPPPQESSPDSNNSTGTSGGLSDNILEASVPATGHEEDAMDISADDDVQEVQASLTATPIVDYASLYQNQGNRWGEFRESAIRSTLPRLG